MWNPGFEYLESALAELNDHRRSFCLASIIYRGTPSAPGLVLGLEPKAGASCRGVAFRVGKTQRDAAIAYLTKREMSNGSYTEETLPLRLSDRREVKALSYVVRTDHVQYRGGATLDEQAAVIARSHGPAGSNVEYLEQTSAALRQLGIADEALERLLEKVRSLIGVVDDFDI